MQRHTRHRKSALPTPYRKHAWAIRCAAPSRCLARDGGVAHLSQWGSGAWRAPGQWPAASQSQKPNRANRVKGCLRTPIPDTPLPPCRPPTASVHSVVRPGQAPARWTRIRVVHGRRPPSHHAMHLAAACVGDRKSTARTQCPENSGTRRQGINGDGGIGTRTTPPRLTKEPVHGSLYRRQRFGTTAGDDPSCQRVALPAKLADPLCRGKLIESRFQDGIGEFRLDRAEFTPDHQTIGTVHVARSTGGVKDNSKFLVHAEPHSDI